MTKATLPPRLEKMASLITVGARIADVGTDHAYLPLYLLEQGIITFAIATDLHPGPLAIAQKNAGNMQGIDFRLADGLSAVLPDEVDTIVIAGMGGETICHILSEAAWTNAGNHKLILQPQTKIGELMAFLSENAFTVTAQHLVCDKGRIYPIYEVQAGKMPNPRGAEILIHHSLLERKDPLLGDYLASQIRKRERVEENLQHASGKKADDTVRADMLMQLKIVEQEVAKWQR